MADVTRLRSITEHYTDLQGLRLVPVGVAFLLVGLLEATGVRPRLPLATALVGITAVFVAALISCHRIGKWYEQRFGCVEGRGNPVSLSVVALILLCVLTASVTLAAAVWPAAVLWGAVSVVRALRHTAILWHYLVIAAGCFLVAALEGLGWSSTATAGSLQMLAGLAFLVAGLGDHQVLCGALTPPHAEDHGRTV